MGDPHQSGDTEDQSSRGHGVQHSRNHYTERVRITKCRPAEAVTHMAAESHHLVPLPLPTPAIAVPGVLTDWL